jgi:hypothetical protein
MLAMPPAPRAAMALVAASRKLVDLANLEALGVKRLAEPLLELSAEAAAAALRSASDSPRCGRPGR